MLERSIYLTDKTILARNSFLASPFPACCRGQEFKSSLQFVHRFGVAGFPFHDEGEAENAAGWCNFSCKCLIKTPCRPRAFPSGVFPACQSPSSRFHPPDFRFRFRASRSRRHPRVRAAAPQSRRPASGEHAAAPMPATDDYWHSCIKNLPRKRRWKSAGGKKSGRHWQLSA